MSNQDDKNKPKVEVIPQQPKKGENVDITLRPTVRLADACPPRQQKPLRRRKGREG